MSFHFSSNTHILLYIHLYQCSLPHQSHLCNQRFHRSGRSWVYIVLHHTQRHSRHSCCQVGEQNRPWCSPSDWPEVSSRTDSHTPDWRRESGNRSGCSAHWPPYCNGWWTLSGGWWSSSQWISHYKYHRIWLTPCWTFVLDLQYLIFLVRGCGMDIILFFSSSILSLISLHTSSQLLLVLFIHIVIVKQYFGLYLPLCISYCKAGGLNYL